MTKPTKSESTILFYAILSTVALSSTISVAQVAAESTPAPQGVVVATESESAAETKPTNIQDALPPAPGQSVPNAQPVTSAPSKSVTQSAPTKEVLALTKTDSGSVKVSGLLQVWAVYQHQKDIDDTSNHASTARVRRAEIKVSGDLVPKKFSFGVMIDPTKTPKFGNATVVTPPAKGETETGTANVLTAAKDNSILQDVYLTYHAPWFELSAGQFKTPVAYESQTSSSKLLLPERAAVVRAYGEQRDVGVKIEKKYEHFGYVLGVFNGSGINRVDDNMQKDVALRLEAYPIKGLTLGAVGYSSVGQREDETSTKDRVEGDVALQIRDLVVQGEYIHGWTGKKGAREEGAGWYGAVGYTIAKVLQPVVRVGQLDPNVDVKKNASTTVEGGVNYFALKDSVKLQLAYAHTGYQAPGAGALNEVTLAGQYKF
jgi:hypothetical protein